MKTTLIWMVIILLPTIKPVSGQELAFNKSAEYNSIPETGLDWSEQQVKLGDIKQGQPAIVEFSFKNQTSEPVLIKSVKPSCGCTVADYSTKPILPGEETTIKVEYNAKNLGYFSKTIAVQTSASESVVPLSISGTVI